MPFTSSVPNRPSGAVTRSIASILADFDDVSADIVDVATATGIADNAKIWRGKSIITTEQVVTSTTYVTAATPDRVQNLWMPTDGLMFIGFTAMWKESVGGAGRSAIFIGANQLQYANNVGPLVQEARTNTATVDRYARLFSAPVGLEVRATPPPSDTLPDATTGQSIGGNSGSYDTNAGVTVSSDFAGGLCVVQGLASGTYDVSVQHKSASGSVTTKNRKLWVWTQGF